MCRDMKDSGVQWIGYIPKAWNITKIKMLSDIYTGTSISDDLKDRYTVKENAIPYISTKDLDISSKSIDYDNGLFIPNGEKGFRLAEKDSTLLCIEGGSAGKKVAFTDRDVNFVNKLCCIKSKDYNNKFIYYYINSSAFTEQFNLNLSGLIGGVSINLLKQIIIVVPTVYEQQKISNYLDKKVSQIDYIISKQKSLIEKYKAYKQSLITETVTKGLNKNVPMKDSGIDYLGYIPYNWSVKRLRFMGTLQNGISKSSEYFGFGYPFLSYGDVYKNEVIPKTVVGLVNSSEQDRESYSVKEGDVFFTRTSETIEEVGIASICMENIKDATFAGFIIRFRPMTDELYKGYSKYYFRCEIHRKFFVKEMNLVTRASLSQELLKKLPILIPSVEEQKGIADFLDKKCEAIDSAISKKEQLIEKLEAYKKSLIYECVTGKRQVN